MGIRCNSHAIALLEKALYAVLPCPIVPLGFSGPCTGIMAMCTGNRVEASDELKDCMNLVRENPTSPASSYVDCIHD